NRNELNKEITYINNILVDYEIDYPIFINIDTLLERKNIFSNINDLITDEKMTAYDIIDSFALNIAQNVVLYGSQTSFLELSDNYKTTPKAIKLEKDEKLIYDGNYNFVSCVIKNANIIENEVVFADNIYSNEGDLLLRINKLTDTEKAIIAKERPISIDGGKYYKGIDVSEFQGDINWETVDPKINYAIIRICDFSNIDDKKQVTIDKKFEYNINECKRLNIPFGIYAVTNAKTTKEAQIEASKIVNTLKPIIKSDEISYPIYLDVEGKDYEQLLKSDPNLVKSVCSTWCETIRNQGYEVGIYSQISILQELKTLNQFYPFWVARYHNDLEIAYDDIKPNDTTDSFKEDSINQVTRKCTIDGIKGPVDVNLTSPTLFNNMLSNPKNYIKSK
ncbi:MAG: GH25 family lysozyme, partial [Bacilli bacterium]